MYVKQGQLLIIALQIFSETLYSAVCILYADTSCVREVFLIKYIFTNVHISACHYLQQTRETDYLSISDRLTASSS